MGKKRAAEAKRSSSRLGRRMAEAEKPETKREAKRDTVVSVAAAKQGSDDKSQRRLWESDGVSPNAPTSLDVLLRWLTTPGNLARWDKQRHKWGLCREVLLLLRQEGIDHRKARDVMRKIGRMRNQFAAAEKWLDASSQRMVLEHGMGTKGVQEKVKDEVLRLCPQYHELAPAMKSFAENEVKTKRERNSSDDGSATDEEPSEIAVPEDSSTESEGEERSSCARPSVAIRTRSTALRAAGTKRRGSVENVSDTKRVRTTPQSRDSVKAPSDAKQKVVDDKKPQSKAEPRAKKNAGRSSQLTKTQAAVTRQVLVEWLATAGNVTRWRQGCNKRAMYRDILVKLEARGMNGRKEDFVRMKMTTLEKQYMKAKKWLLETGLFGDFVSGKTTREINGQVAKLCPKYRQLAAILDGSIKTEGRKETRSLSDDKTSVGKEASGIDSSSSDENETKDDEEETEDDEEETKDEQGQEKAVQAERPSSLTSSGGTGLTRDRPIDLPAGNAKRGVPLDDVKVKEEVESPILVLSPHTGPDPTIAKQASWENVSREERKQRQELFELKRAVLQKELEAKKTQLEIQVVRDKMLARQKLLDAGVSPVDVDRALPL